MNKEDYFKYYIQGSDHYLIPRDIFDELFNEMNNWKEENQALKRKIKLLENNLNQASKECKKYRNKRQTMRHRISRRTKQRDKYKEVIEEVSKYMKENRTRYIYQDNLGEDWWFEDLDVYSELLQILDKGVDK